MPRDEIVITISGKAAQSIKDIQRITGKKEPLEVIIAALRAFEWILAQQTKKCIIVSEPTQATKEEFDPDAKEIELVKYVLDQEQEDAVKFFKNRDIFIPQKKVA